MTGLVFVALSINLKQILAGPGLPSRAAEAIILLMQPVVLGAIALVPGQSNVALGVEVLVTGAVTWTLISRMIYRARSALATLAISKVAIRVVFAEAATVATLVAGIMLVVGASQGLDVLAAGLIVCLVDGVLDAWVLLVEILR